MTKSKSPNAGSPGPDKATCPPKETSGGLSLGAVFWIGLVGLSLIWAFWPVVVGLVREWRNNDNYSVGMLVPCAAVYLIWSDRASLRGLRIGPCWWGLGLILLGLLARGFGFVRLYESAERYGLVLAIVGCVLLLAGRAVFRRVQWALLFLFLMVPLPGRIHEAVSTPLQQWATQGAVFGLELIGVTVFRQGNQLFLDNNVQVNIAEECSGLRMLTAFVVVAYAFAYLSGRSVWQKVILVLTSVPVAIFANIARLIVTALMFLYLRSDLAETFFHDFAGIFMMPVAVAVLFGETWVLSKLVIADDDGPSARAAPKTLSAMP